MFEPFSHFLSYGATDQATARRLSRSYDGLMVPGTVAAFQRAGTGGFVLTLSATAAAPTYVIDPRFPLFQQALPNPKKSHESLATLLGAPELIRSVDPLPEDFSEELVNRVAAHWAAFNSGYTEEAQKSFSKYAAKLGEAIEPINRRGPAYVFPPYLIAQQGRRDWWEVSNRLFDATANIVDPARLVRVVATDSSTDLGHYLGRLSGQPRAAIWVSGLNELTSAAEELASYGSAIAQARTRGVATFALYGGFFSVLLRSVGLSGSSHGIGYGESRDWVELPQSGPPPARYYLPLAHRYVSQDLAYQLWSRNRPLAVCHCQVCNGDPPIALDYQALMDHSVLCRAQEIRAWTSLELADARSRLRAEHQTLRDGIDGISLPGPLRNQAAKAHEHLPRWERALELLT